MAVYDWAKTTCRSWCSNCSPAQPALHARCRHAPESVAGAHVGRQVTSALEYSHARGLVHRDIKPRTCSSTNTASCASPTSDSPRAGEASWTEPAGTVVGTARYAAPEQASGARSTAARISIHLRWCWWSRSPERFRGWPTPRSDARAARPHLARRAARARPPRTGRGARGTRRPRRPLPRCRDDACRTGRRRTRAPAAAAARARGPLRRDLHGRSHPDRSLVAPVRPGRARARTRARCGRAAGRPRTPGSVRWVGAIVAAVVVLALLAAGVAVAGTGGGGTVTVPSLVGLSTKSATDRAASAGSR